MGWIYGLLIVLGLGIDQLIKYWAIIKLPAGQEQIIIPNFLAFIRLNNHGAAYNILSGQRLFFLIITVIAIVVLLFLLIKYGRKSHFLGVSLSLLLAGALGNALDRLLHGYVVDMIYLNIFNLPFLNFICNFADILITSGVVLLIIYIFKTDN